MRWPSPTIRTTVSRGPSGPMTPSAAWRSRRASAPARSASTRATPWTHSHRSGASRAAATDANWAARASTGTPTPNPLRSRQFDRRRVHLDDRPVEIDIIELAAQHDGVTGGDEYLGERQRRD